MEQNKDHLSSDNITEWLASTGFLFPRNEQELSRFEKLYSELDEGISGNEIDPERIIRGETPSKIVDINKKDIPEPQIEKYKMVARNSAVISKHILEKMKKNQDNHKSNNDGLSKKTD